MAKWLQSLACLLPERIANPRLFLLQQLPKDSVGVEIGVHLGDFSEQILKIVQPRQLHLIDPWHFEPAATYKKAWYGGKAEGGQAEMDDRHQSVLRRFAAPIARGQVQVHRGFSTDIGIHFADAYFD